jgi:hypothetical protein
MQIKRAGGPAFITALLLLATSSHGVLAQSDAAAQPQPPAEATSASQSNVPAPAPQPAMPKEKIDQMLAPIALYPDPLVTNVLMASTYPLEVVEASRWLRDPKNAALKGDALLDAIRPLSWDPSVKFLLPFPQIVQQLNDHLDWTRDLGTAFTYQQQEVMAEVQHLRQLSMSCGKLQSTPQQTVTRQGGVIAIAPTNPDTVYVPVYNPQVAYGGWAYPDYPPLFFPPPPGFLLAGAGFDIGVGIGFSFGFGVVGPLWGWSYPNWGAGSVVVNYNQVNRFNSFNEAALHDRFAGGAWHHAGDPALHGAASATFAASHRMTADPRTASMQGASSHVRSLAHNAYHGHAAHGRSYAHAGHFGHAARYAHAGASHGYQHARGNFGHGPAGGRIAMGGGGAAHRGGGAPHGGPAGGHDHH